MSEKSKPKPKPECDPDENNTGEIDLRKMGATLKGNWDEGGDYSCLGSGWPLYGSRSSNT